MPLIVKLSIPQQARTPSPKGSAPALAAMASLPTPPGSSPSASSKTSSIDGHSDGSGSSQRSGDSSLVDLATYAIDAYWWDAPREVVQRREDKRKREEMEALEPPKTNKKRRTTTPPRPKAGRGTTAATTPRSPSNSQTSHSGAERIWSRPKAEEAYQLAQETLPMLGRNKAWCFGVELGRNQIIATVVSIATGRLYDRKSISSHSQTLNNGKKTKSAAGANDATDNNDETNDKEEDENDQETDEAKDAVKVEKVEEVQPKFTTEYLREEFDLAPALKVFLGWDESVCCRHMERPEVLSDCGRMYPAGVEKSKYEADQKDKQKGKGKGKGKQVKKG